MRVSKAVRAATPEGLVVMGATDQEYSDSALRASRDLRFQFQWADEETAVRSILDVAHNRKALGLDASMHAASYRREVIEEAAAALQREADRQSAAHAPDAAAWLACAGRFLLREFKSNGATDA